jgi:hypothetical protein
MACYHAPPPFCVKLEGMRASGSVASVGKVLPFVDADCVYVVGADVAKGEMKGG